MSFNKKGYQLIKKVIPKDMANLASNYLLIKQQVLNTLLKNKIISPYQQDYGINNDTQVIGAFSIYGDALMDCFLLKLHKKIEQVVGEKLFPTYSYARVYMKGNELKIHKDRKQCKFSTTLNLGGDNWPIYMDDTPITLSPGDMVVYKGCDIKHYRKPFTGDYCTQVFLHYVDKNLKESELDGRPHIGLGRYDGLEEGMEYVYDK
tara:strand:- start:593 stop:1207 length:615 start_codon:yes stop_codon:yes gene_type:complete